MLHHSTSPEYRQDLITGRWVILAPERATRPLALSHVKPHDRHDDERDRCPFCEGREDQTPAERYARRDPRSVVDGPGWQLRVVPNKFPAVRPGLDPALRPSDPGFRSRPGLGDHELVIPCARHESNLVNLTRVEFVDLLECYRHRLIWHAAQPDWQSATIFQNVGAEAGASLAHLHAQILVTSMIPDGIQLELDGAARFHSQTGQCVFCAMIERELLAGVRIVATTPRFVALVPFAGRFAYETWFLPRTHQSRYEEMPTEDMGELAELIRDMLQRLDRVLIDPAYNLIWHTTPLKQHRPADYHWHIELIPRTSRAAGFEWGSGCFINTVAPESAAEQFRSTGRGNLANPQT